MLTAYQYIKDHVNVKIAPSKIHGVGVFAIRDIDENEILFTNWENESGIYTISENELNSLEPQVIDHLLDMFVYKKTGEFTNFEVELNKDCYWIYKTPLHWVNSCSYNDEPNFDRKTLKTNREIKCGEELLIKYGKYDKYERFKSNNSYKII